MQFFFFGYLEAVRAECSLSRLIHCRSFSVLLGIELGRVWEREREAGFQVCHAWVEARIQISGPGLFPGGQTPKFKKLVLLFADTGTGEPRWNLRGSAWPQRFYAPFHLGVASTCLPW